MLPRDAPSELRPVWAASLGASVGTAAPGSRALEPGLVRLDRPPDDRSRPVVDHVGSFRPTFLARHPAGTRIYATEQTPDGRIHTFTTGPDRSLHRVSTVPSRGDHPCHLHVHPNGRWLYVSNYADATVTAIGLDSQGDPSGTTAALPYRGSSVHPQRQSSAHAHAAAVTPDGGFLVVADLGGDVLRSYPLTPSGPTPRVRITPLPAGSGPRHLLFAGEHLYVTCELSGEVAVIAWDAAAGTGTVLQRAPATDSADAPAFLSHLVLAGDVLIVGVRTPGTLAVLAVEESGARLRRITEVPTVAWPTHFEIIGDQLLVAGTRADAIGAHRLAPCTAPAETVGPLGWSAQVPQPMCVVA